MVSLHVLFPNYTKERKLTAKGHLTLVVEKHRPGTAARLIITDEAGHEKLMNILMYPNVRVLQEGQEVRVKVIHAKKGSLPAKIVHYILGTPSVDDAKALFFAFDRSNRN